MNTDPFFSRLAVRARLPVAAVAVASLVLAIANVCGVIGDQSIVLASIIVGAAAAAMFLSAVFDIRFQRALSALNAERRSQARQIGRLSRVTGWGLPLGDRLLVMISLPLLAMTLFAANILHRLPATTLLFVGFALTTVVQIGSMVRGQSTDCRSDPFA